VQSDYFKNHKRAGKFPWSIYHAPISAHLIDFVSRGLTPAGSELLIIGPGMLEELPRLPQSLRITIADIDERVLQLVESYGDPRIKRLHLATPVQCYADYGAFDLIYAKEVIEHFNDPMIFLRETFKALRPGGRLWVSTPNYGGMLLPMIERTFLELVAKIDGSTRKDIHPFMFDITTLQTYLEKSGFAKHETREISMGLALIGTAEKPARAAI
jgi:SAM-dependent methyltransferase